MLNLARSLFADIKRHAGVVGYSTAGSLLQATVLPLVILPFLAHNLSSDAFGQFAVLLSVMGYLITVIGGNLAIVVFRNHKDLESADRRDFFGMVLWLGVFVAGSLSILGLVFYDQIALRWGLPEGQLFVLPLLIYMFGVSLSTPANSFLGADLLFKPLFHARLVYFVFSLSVIGAYYIWPDTYWNSGFAIGPIMLLGVLLAQAWQRNIVNLAALPGASFIKGIGADIAVFGVAALILNFVIYGDRWLMAEAGVSFSTVAAYSIAVQAGMLLIFATEQLSTLFIPLVSNLRSLDDLTSQLTKKLFLVMAFLVMGVLAAGSILGQLYIQLLYGDAYWNEARTIFYVLLVGISFYPIQMLARGFFIRFHPAAMTLIINAAGLAVMLGALYFFGHSIGAVDFAIARSMALGAIGLGYFGVVFLPLWWRVR